MKKQRKSTENAGMGSWKQFGAFFRHARLSWGWIIASMLITMAYYAVVTELPGSTAALMNGKFTRKAITDVIVNYGLTMILLVIVGVGSLIAEAKSVLSVRKAVWTRMMGIRSDFYDEHSAGSLFSAVTSDAETAVVLLLQLLVTVPGLITYLVKALPMIRTFSPKLLWAVLVLIPVYILYAIFMGRWQFKVGMKIQMRIGGLTGYLTDRIRNLSMIKSFVTEDTEETRGVEAAHRLYRSNVEYAWINGVVVGYTILV